MLLIARGMRLFYSQTPCIAWKASYFWIVLVGGVVSGYISNQISTITENGDTVPMYLSLLSTVIGLAIAVINLLMNMKLSEKFGHGILFGLGLTFLTPIFTMILGLGASEYFGNPQEGLPPQRRAYM